MERYRFWNCKKLGPRFSPDTPQLQGLLVLLVHESSPRELSVSQSHCVRFSSALSFTTCYHVFTLFHPLSLRTGRKMPHPPSPSFQHVESPSHLIQTSLGEAMFPHLLGMLSEHGRLLSKLDRGLPGRFHPSRLSLNSMPGWKAKENQTT